MHTPPLGLIFSASMPSACTQYANWLANASLICGWGEGVARDGGGGGTGRRAHCLFACRCAVCWRTPRQQELASPPTHLRRPLTGCTAVFPWLQNDDRTVTVSPPRTPPRHPWTGPPSPAPWGWLPPAQAEQAQTQTSQRAVQCRHVRPRKCGPRLGQGMWSLQSRRSRKAQLPNYTADSGPPSGSPARCTTSTAESSSPNTAQQLERTLTGPMPMTEGCTPTAAKERSEAIMGRPRRSASARLISMTQAAPSVVCADATWRQSGKAGRWGGTCVASCCKGACELA